MSDDRSRWGCPLLLLVALATWAAVLLAVSRVLA